MAASKNSIDSSASPDLARRSSARPGSGPAVGLFGFPRGFSYLGQAGMITSGRYAGLITDNVSSLTPQTDNIPPNPIDWNPGHKHKPKSHPTTHLTHCVSTETLPVMPQLKSLVVRRPSHGPSLLPSLSYYQPLFSIACTRCCSPSPYRQTKCHHRELCLTGWTLGKYSQRLVRISCPTPTVTM